LARARFMNAACGPGQPCYEPGRRLHVSTRARPAPRMSQRRLSPSVLAGHAFAHLAHRLTCEYAAQGPHGLFKPRTHDTAGGLAGLPSKALSRGTGAPAPAAAARGGTCPAFRLSFLPPQALSADACRARPYEKLSVHGLRRRADARQRSNAPASAPGRDQRAAGHRLRAAGRPPRGLRRGPRRLCRRSSGRRRGH